MPTKHIDSDTWAAVEELYVKTVTCSSQPVKESELLRVLIRKGLDTVQQEDLDRLAANALGGVLLVYEDGHIKLLNEPLVSNCVISLASRSCQGMIVYGKPGGEEYWRTFADRVLQEFRQQFPDASVKTEELDYTSNSLVFSNIVKTIFTYWTPDVGNVYRTLIGALLPDKVKNIDTTLKDIRRLVSYCRGFADTPHPARKYYFNMTDALYVAGIITSIIPNLSSIQSGFSHEDARNLLRECETLFHLTRLADSDTTNQLRDCLNTITEITDRYN